MLGGAWERFLSHFLTKIQSVDHHDLELYLWVGRQWLMPPFPKSIPGSFRRSCPSWPMRVCFPNISFRPLWCSMNVIQMCINWQRNGWCSGRGPPDWKLSFHLFLVPSGESFFFRFGGSQKKPLSKCFHTLTILSLSDGCNAQLLFEKIPPASLQLKKNIPYSLICWV
jgi:hypothetical protein